MQKNDPKMYLIFDFSKLILDRLGPQLASQLGPKIAPRSVQEPSKIHPNLHLIIDHFFY